MPTAPHIPPVNELIREAAEKATHLPRGHMSALAREIGTERNAITTRFSGRSTPHREFWPAIERHLDIPPGTLRRAAADFFDPDYAALRDEVDQLRTRLARALARAARLRDRAQQLEDAKQ